MSAPTGGEQNRVALPVATATPNLRFDRTSDDSRYVKHMARDPAVAIRYTTSERPMEKLRVAMIVRHPNSKPDRAEIIGS
jgi:hypothetical protein